MKAVFSTFAVIFMQLSLATLADTKPHIWDNGTKTDFDKIADAKTLLSAEKYETYRAMLSRQNCDAAASILNKAFVDRYPELSFTKEAES